jgi:hypothetical protein
VREVIAAGDNTAVHDPQRLVQVFSDIAAIDIGVQQIADQRRAISALGVGFACA